MSSCHIPHLIDDTMMIFVGKLHGAMNFGIFDHAIDQKTKPRT